MRFFISAIAFALALTPAFAAVQGKDGFYHTGDGIQTAAHWPFTMELFTVAHDTKDIPAVKTRQAMIELDADKRLTLRMLRDVSVSHLKTGLEDRYRLNGYCDADEIHRFLAGLQGLSVPTGSSIVITYDANSKTTTLAAPSGSVTSVQGVKFMEATWSIWFGVSKPASLGDQLIAKL